MTIFFTCDPIGYSAPGQIVICLDGIPWYVGAFISITAAVICERILESLFEVRVKQFRKAIEEWLDK